MCRTRWKLSIYIENYNKIKLLLDEPLRRVRDVKDELCVKNGKLVDDNIKIPTDELLIDGEVGDVGEIVLKDREMLSDNGVVVAVITIDRLTKTLKHPLELHSRGFIYVRDNIDVMKEAVNIATKVVNDNTKPNFIDYNKIKLGVRDELGKYFYNEIGTKPMILLIIQEV